MTEEEPGRAGLLGIAQGGLPEAAPVEQKLNKTQNTTWAKESTCWPRCSLPSTPNTQCGGGPFRAILCRTRLTRDFTRESLTFEEERQRWREDSV